MHALCYAASMLTQLNMALNLSKKKKCCMLVFWCTPYICNPITDINVGSVCFGKPEAETLHFFMLQLRFNFQFLSCDASTCVMVKFEKKYPKKKISKGATWAAVTGFRSVSPVNSTTGPPSSDLHENSIHSDTFNTTLSGTWILELRRGGHRIFQTRSLTAENKTGFDGWNHFRHDCCFHVFYSH